MSQQALALQQLTTLVGNGTPRATPERNCVKTNNASVKSKHFAIPLGVLRASLSRSPSSRLLLSLSAACCVLCQ